MTLRYDNMVSPVVGDGFDAVDGLGEKVIGDLANHHADGAASAFFEAEGDRVRAVIVLLGILDHQLLGFGADLVASA